MTSSRPWPSRKACAAAPTRAAPPSPPPRRTNGSARPSSASALARAGPGADREGARDDVRDDDGTDSDRTGRDRKEGGAQADGGKPERKGPSLKMRAVGYLSRREHARAELACKLAPHAEDPAEIEAVLDALEKEGWLSTERFAQSLVHRRASRQGRRASCRAAPAWRGRRPGGRIARSASVHRARARAGGLAQALRRKAGRPRGYAKQARFLASRGFAQDVIRRILGGAGDEE